MPHKRFVIDHAPASAPTTLDSVGRARSVPEDILHEASRRLGVLALIAAVLWITGTILGHVAADAVGHGAQEVFHSTVSDTIAVVSVVLSVALFFYTRGSRRDPRFILDLGLVYEVFTAMAIGLSFHWSPVPDDWLIIPMISWIGAVVLIFPALVPSTPLKTAIAGLISVSMNPISMLIARARGTWDFGPASKVILMHYPDFMLVGVAVVISHVLTRLRRQVAKEREMGSYHLGELLGRGGMGEVYRATHRMLARPAAIKLIRPEMISAQGEGAQMAVERFRREAEAAAQLRSPHTVELYDFGVTEDGTLYFVMELLDGMDLETLIRTDGPQPPGRVVNILRQVCRSLEEAHARGLVHRDVKPANIHIGRLGLVNDFVKVLDFGLVKSIAPGGTAQTNASATGFMLGTPSYMAPEMAGGTTVDGRADIYALGCVGYVLLTGSPVFEAENVMQMIAIHLRDEPVPPSRRTQRSIPPQLERVILDCLAKRPDARPQSAAAVAEALAAVEVEPWKESDAAQWWNARPALPVASDDDEDTTDWEGVTAVMK